MRYDTDKFLILLRDTVLETERSMTMSCYKFNSKRGFNIKIMSKSDRCSFLTFGDDFRVIATPNRICIEGKDDRYTAIWAVIISALYEVSSRFEISIKRIFHDFDEKVQVRDNVLNYCGLEKLGICDQDYLFFDWVVDKF